MNILFVCSANKDRSRTADDYFSTVYGNFKFNSAGTNHKICHQEGTTVLTQELIHWADFIFVMEQRHKHFIDSFAMKNHEAKIQVLQIPDRYKYYQKELIELLKEKVIPYLEKFENV